MCDDRASRHQCAIIDQLRLPSRPSPLRQVLNSRRTFLLLEAGQSSDEYGRGPSLNRSRHTGNKAISNSGAGGGITSTGGIGKSPSLPLSSCWRVTARAD